MKHFYLICFLLIFVGCNENNLSFSGQEPENVSQELSEKYLTESEGIRRAYTSLNSFLNRPREEHSRAISASVRLYTGSASRGDDSVNPLYIVNFDKGGFAIVSALRNASDEAFAVSEDGYFDETGNYALQEYLQDISTSQPLASIMGGIRDSIIYEHDYILPEGWYRLGLNSDTVVRPVNIKEVYDMEFIPKWGQLGMNTAFTLNHFPAGCAPVAIGQICAHNEKPKSWNGINFDWKELKASPLTENLGFYEQQDIAQFIADIGALCQTTYAHDGSGTYYENSYNGFVQLGYTSAAKSTSFDACFKSIQQKHPVFIESSDLVLPDERHAWVVDGGRYQLFEEYYHDRKTLKEICRVHHSSSKYLRFNWGYKGKSDGYYLAYKSYCSKIDPNYPDKEFEWYYTFHYEYTLDNGDTQPVEYGKNTKYIINLY